MPKYQLVIFDLDGVLTETSEKHFQAWSFLFKKHFNIDLDPELESKTKGVSRMDSMRILLKSYDLLNQFDSKTIEQMAHEKNTVYQTLIKDISPKDLFDGVIELLDFLKESNIKLALGSASKNGPFIIKQLGIGHYFDVVVDPSDLNGKPAPDIFLKASTALNVAPNLCIAFEDAIAGIKAIKRAGMTAIGIGTEDLSLADGTYHKIKDVPFDLF